MNESGVVIGLSGGVDSATAAWYLKSRGYDVYAVTINFFDYSGGYDHSKSCCDRDAMDNAARVAKNLGIAHRIVDASEKFKREVIERFVREYEKGRTPNPCIECNAKVKFPTLIEVADELNYKHIATGHYARVIKKRSGRRFLARALSVEKDQSYFLYKVPVNIIERTIFPLGFFTKERVESFYKKHELGAAHRRESQDVCFLPDGDIERFLAEFIRNEGGNIVDMNGNVLGRHRGIHLYTVGQRKGLGISSSKPLYVKSIDASKRQIVVATKERLFSNEARCANLNLRSRKLETPLYAKIRYRHPPAAVESFEIKEGTMRIIFKEPQRAVTPGQSLVLYQDGFVVGGGIIVEGACNE